MITSTDPTFLALPLRIRYSIDRAFNRYGVFPEEELQDPSPSGGFIPEPKFSKESDDDEVIPASSAPTRIALSQIPSALQYLDLPPNDEQVLGVLRNAASGWNSTFVESAGATPDGELVSREDWRAVCAVLLEGRGEDDFRSGDNAGQGNVDKREKRTTRSQRQRRDTYNHSDSTSVGGGFIGSYEEDTEVDKDEEYVDSGTSEEEDQDDDDEYVNDAKGLKRLHTRSSRRASSTPPPGSPSEQKGLTPRQQQGCREAYALFFPDVTEEQLLQQRIMIKDVQRVAKTLGEHIRTEEIIEMLDMFSASPDKSMSYIDFCRMMVKAKLV